jgi:hypothetical protein
MADIIKRVRTGPPDGHPRYGGRRPGSVNKKTATLKNLAEQMGTDPAETLLNIVQHDCIQVPMIDEVTGKPLTDANGKPMLKWITFSTRMRMDACKELMPYLAPRLASVALSGSEGGPIKIATLDVTQIILDEDTARAAQRMALMLADQMDPNAQSSAPAVPYDTSLVPIQKTHHE